MFFLISICTDVAVCDFCEFLVLEGRVCVRFLSDFSDCASVMCEIILLIGVHLLVLLMSFRLSPYERG